MLPATWMKMIKATKRYCPVCKRCTVSAENVENVVSPPRNPVEIKSLELSEKKSGWITRPIKIPIKKPPIRLAKRVPRGIVGNIGLRSIPRDQRRSAPIDAPRATAITANISTFTYFFFFLCSCWATTFLVLKKALGLVLIEDMPQSTRNLANSG